VARSPHGSRRTLPWAAAQSARPVPRIVRLGRAANDNARVPAERARVIVVCVMLALAAYAAAERLF